MGGGGKINVVPSVYIIGNIYLPKPVVNSTTIHNITPLDHVPGARDKIAFDRFHVMRKKNEAVDKVRRRVYKSLVKEGVNDLKGTKYDWLTTYANMPEGQRRRFRQLRASSLKTSLAWALKVWNRWLCWAMRSRLDPMKDVARMVRKHLWGIINAVVLKVSNGPAESFNSRIKMITVKIPTNFLCRQMTRGPLEQGI